MNNKDIIKLGESIFLYSQKYNIPINNIIEILEDQKVLPMIRGKAMEYNAYQLLTNNLPSINWNIQKLNLNAQQGQKDEDINIIHRKTGIKIKVESKSSVRGSFSIGIKSRILKEPHFIVKCHRSRSSLKLAKQSNDRYSDEVFDLIITNPTNSIIQGNTIGESFEIIRKPDIKEFLFKYYNAQDLRTLLNITENDWRVCYAKSISVNGYLPRTPYVKLQADENWKKIDELENLLMKVVEEKRKNNYAKSRN